MKTYITQATLKDVFTKLAKVYSSKVTVQVLTNVKVEVTTEATYFTVSNINQSLVVKVENENIGEQIEGVMLYDFKKLSTFVKKVKSNVIEINDNIVAAGKLKLTLNPMDSSEYPKMPKIEDTVINTLSSDEFKKAINKTSYAVSKSESRPVLMGINVQFKDYITSFIATDSHRLVKHDVKNENNNVTDVVWSGAGMDKLVSIIGKNKNDIKININEYHTVFSNGEIEFYEKNLEGNYPNTSRLIPDNFKTNVTLNAKELSDVLPNLEMISKDDRCNSISLNLNGSVKIEASNNKKEKMEMELEYSNRYGDDIEIHFQNNFLSDVLKRTDNEYLKFNFSDSMRPFTIEDGQTINLILPVRKY